MASRLVAAATSSSSSSSASPMARLISRRGLAGVTGHYSYCHPKVNLWEDPTRPTRWKTSHFVVATLTIWGCLNYAGFKLFGGEKEIETKVPAAKVKAKAKAKAK